MYLWDIPKIESIIKMKPKTSKYADQYCKIHDQWFADFLDECPICAGEKMTGIEPPPTEEEFQKMLTEAKSKREAKEASKKKVKLVKRVKVTQQKKTEHSSPKLFDF